MTYTGPEAMQRYMANVRKDPSRYATFLEQRKVVRKRWQEENRDKHNAHNKVYRAIKKGLLVRPDACQKCSKKCRPEAAHTDYSKPLDVMWLCRQCHAAMDSGRD